MNGRNSDGSNPEDKLVIPEDLRQAYAYERGQALASVAVTRKLQATGFQLLIERIARAEAELATLRASNEELVKALEMSLKHLNGFHSTHGCRGSGCFICAASIPQIRRAIQQAHGEAPHD